MSEDLVYDEMKMLIFLFVLSLAADSDDEMFVGTHLERVSVEVYSLRGARALESDEKRNESIPTTKPAQSTKSTLTSMTTAQIVSISSASSTVTDNNTTITTISPNTSREGRIFAVRVIDRSKSDSLIQKIKTNLFHLIGENLNIIQYAYLTTSGHCFTSDPNTRPVKMNNMSPNMSFSRQVEISTTLEENSLYHFCSEKVNDSLFSWRKFVKIQSVTDADTFMFPIFIQIPLIVVLSVLSALFSGLNIGLMSLSVSSLELIIKHDERQRKYAQNILPLRKNGNLLLCTILIGNTFVNNCVTLLLSNTFDQLQGLDPKYMILLSIVTPSVIIVIIGEILPQAICCRYGLIVGSKTRYLTIFMIVVTFVVSYPLSKVLDWLIGVEGPESFDKEMLTHIVEMNVEPGKGLSKATANLLVRALQYNEKVTVSRIMTPIEKVFMLPESTVVDLDLLKRIHDMGHTRIPIFKDGNRNMIIAIINVKDLVPIDPKCQLRIGTVAQVWQRSRHFRFVLEDFPISQLLKEMKRGQPLALVVRFNETIKDYDVTGVIALEDIVEEITGEILDEKDLKRKRC